MKKKKWTCRFFYFIPIRACHFFFFFSNRVILHRILIYPKNKKKNTNSRTTCLKKQSAWTIINITYLSFPVLFFFFPLSIHNVSVHMYMYVLFLFSPPLLSIPVLSSYTSRVKRHPSSQNYGIIPNIFIAWYVTFFSFLSSLLSVSFFVFPYLKIVSFLVETGVYNKLVRYIH